MPREYKFQYKICENPMVKAGKNDKGKQRYKCKNCKTRTLVKKQSKSRQNELKAFANWLIDSTKVDHKSRMPRRTFYRKTNWCWSVIPKINSDGIQSEFIFVDAIYQSKNQCLLIVRDDKSVLNYVWSESENTGSYTELLQVLPKPKFLICDGHAGIIKASTILWENIAIQRCIVHVMHSAQRKLGKRSPSPVNQIFRRHINKLALVDTVKKSENWQKKFHALYEKHKDYIEEFSLSISADTGEVTRRFRTHKKLFSACNEINKLLQSNRLFVYITHGIPNNANHLEGGINSPLKNLLRCHRGIASEHQKRMWEWYLLSRSATPIDGFIKTLNLDELSTRNGN